MLSTRLCLVAHEQGESRLGQGDVQRIAEQYDKYEGHVVHMLQCAHLVGQALDVATVEPQTSHNTPNEYLGLAQRWCPLHSACVIDFINLLDLGHQATSMSPTGYCLWTIRAFLLSLRPNLTG